MFDRWRQLPFSASALYKARGLHLSMVSIYVAIDCSMNSRHSEFFSSLLRTKSPPMDDTMGCSKSGIFRHNSRKCDFEKTHSTVKNPEARRTVVWTIIETAEAREESIYTISHGTYSLSGPMLFELLKFLKSKSNIYAI